LKADVEELIREKNISQQNEQGSQARIRVLKNEIKIENHSHDSKKSSL